MTDVIFLVPVTKEGLADWREHEVHGVVAEQPEGCCATELRLSIEYPGMFELKVSGPHDNCQDFCYGYGRDPDIIDGIAITPLAESANCKQGSIQ